VKPSNGHADTIVNGISRIGFMSGGKSARWVDEEIAPTITGKAVSFIERNRERPFFLYFATHDIHVPRVPNGQFRGTSGCGIRCDAIRELDWSAGRILETLERLKLTGDTMVIFTSDNGPVLDNGYADGSVEDANGHLPAGPLRGGKSSIYEGGTRVPFIARWPGRIKPGVSGALLGQMDLVASFAALTGRRLAADAAPDSFNVLPALLGDSQRGRDHLVEYANALAIRRGAWKLIPADRVTGIVGPRRAGRNARSSAPELYDLASDIGETKNLAPERPEVVAELTALLDKVRTGGRSRP
jgi:arylsulfatase A-like enzyme